MATQERFHGWLAMAKSRNNNEGISASEMPIFPASERQVWSRQILKRYTGFQPYGLIHGKNPNDS